MLIGIISGSGTEAWPGLEDAQPAVTQTAYGAVELATGRIGAVDVVHLSRHGPSHRHLSNHVEHRTNLSALMEARVDAVIAFTACGAVDPSVPLGAAVVFDDLYFPSNRLPDGSLCTWHDRPGTAGPGHWIFDRPFSDPLRHALVRAGQHLDTPVVAAGTYGHVDGPRFNSKAEIAALAGAGVTAVSQTAGPETVLAGEAGVPYVLVGFVTDYANGVSDDPEPAAQLLARAAQGRSILASLTEATMALVTPDDLVPAGAVLRFDP